MEKIASICKNVKKKCRINIKKRLFFEKYVIFAEDKLHSAI